MDRADHLVPRRLVHAPGDVASGQLRTEVFPVLVVVAAHSRFITAVMLPSRATADLLCGGGCCGTTKPAPGGADAWPKVVLPPGRRMVTTLVHARPHDPGTTGVVELTDQHLSTF